MKATAGATSSRHFCLYLELPKQSSAVLLKAKYRQEPGEEGHTRDPERVRSSELWWRRQPGKVQTLGSGRL